MLLLHLSDLHFGNKNRFSDDKPSDLGKAFHGALVAARKDRNIPDSEATSLVIVTGDFVESGLPSEFNAAREFLTSLAGEMKLPLERFVLLPGNHDISWAACKKVRAACANEDFPPAELDERLHKEKLANYRDFLAKFYNAPANADAIAILANSQPLKCGGWLRHFPDLRLSVAALNTSEREDDEVKGGFLSPEQAQALMTAWQDKDAAPRLKILAMHHNPTATTAGNRD
jgi:3',5'-cyclic AMP phosphodiesterase CpdA